jgi:hypothetical protein
MNNIPKNARTLALCGDHSNYTFEQADYNTAGRDKNYLFSSIWGKEQKQALVISTKKEFF